MKYQQYQKSKYQQYCRCFIVCILVPYPSWFSSQWNMVTIVISAAIIGGALIRGVVLIWGNIYIYIYIYIYILQCYNETKTK